MIGPAGFIAASFGEKIAPIIDEDNYSPAGMIAQFFVNKGLASAPQLSQAWPVFISFMPAANPPNVPVNCIAIYDTTGIMDGRYQDDGTQIQHPGIQIRVRSRYFPDGYNRSVSLQDEMDAAINYVLDVGENNFLIQNISRRTNIVPLGNEPDTNFELFTINAICTIRPLTLSGV